MTLNGVATVGKIKRAKMWTPDIGVKEIVERRFSAELVVQAYSEVATKCFLNGRGNLYYHESLALVCYAAPRERQRENAWILMHIDVRRWDTYYYLI